jgi:hypothetical protein
VRGKAVVAVAAVVRHSGIRAARATASKCAAAAAAARRTHVDIGEGSGQLPDEQLVLLHGARRGEDAGPARKMCLEDE